VRSDQVLGSLIGFGLIYLLLGAVWLFVLDRKIRQGPESPGARHDGEGDLRDAAAARPAMTGDLTGDRRGVADETA
jgi:cytochrome bd-type quinol oxidase subunit 1